jgi:hypothetical protein
VPPQKRPGLYVRLRWRLSPIRFITGKGLRDGLFGGRRRWLVALLAVRGLVAAKRAVSRQVEVLAVDQLKPGERIYVRTIPVHSAKERKQLLRGR